MEPVEESSSEEWKDFDEVLVEMVQTFPCLYNKQLRDYKNKVTRDAAWNSIATVMNCQPAKCSSRWNALRDSYSREVRKRLVEERSGSGPSRRRGFALFEKMSFLREHYTERRAFSNVMYPSNTSQLSSLNANAIYILPHNISRIPERNVYQSSCLNLLSKQMPTPPRSVSPPEFGELDSPVVGKDSNMPENEILQSNGFEFLEEPHEISTFPDYANVACTSRTDINNNSNSAKSVSITNSKSSTCAPMAATNKAPTNVMSTGISSPRNNSTCAPMAATNKAPTNVMSTGISSPRNNSTCAPMAASNKAPTNVMSTDISSPTSDSSSKATSCYNPYAMKRKKKDALEESFLDLSSTLQEHLIRSQEKKENAETKSPTSVNDMFGNLISLELSILDEPTRQRKKAKILDILYERE